MRGLVKSLLLIVFSSLLLVHAAAAQEPLSSLEGVHVDVPDGWQSTIDFHTQTIIVATSIPVAEAVSAGQGGLQPGDIGVSIAVPGALGIFGIDADADPTQALLRIVDRLGASGKVVETNQFGVPAARVDAKSSLIPGGQALVYALGFDGGTVLISVLAGNPADETSDTVNQIIASITYERPSARSSTSGVPAPEVTEPASAGSNAPATVGSEPLSQWAVRASATSEYGTSSWSAAQATGEPNATSCGDNGSAWASTSATGKDSLTLFFNQLVFPSQVNIHQNYNPGAITGVQLANSETGETFDLPNSADPVGNTACPGVFSLTIDPLDFPVDSVVITLDQTLTNNWNEIDAVELIGLPALTGLIRQWATEASASSEYGTTSWSASQAAGAPDATYCGDSSMAWASESATGKDTLTLNFDLPVIPSQVNIYQNYNPGAITGIQLVNTETGATFSVPKSADPVGNTDCPGIFSLDISGIDAPVDQVIITLDQTLTNNWNEIDAVQLIGSPAS